MRQYAALALYACLLGPATGAGAQQLELLPSAASRCLQPSEVERGLPEYPFAAWKNGLQGRVLVELEFNAADRPPRVRVLEQEGPSSLVDAVQEHVGSYRVPCLVQGEPPAKLRMDFVFQRDQRRVLSSAPADADTAERLRMLRCVRHPDNDKMPDYPKEALRREVQGRVLAKLRFVAPDQPPIVEIFSRPSARMLTNAPRQWLADVRMPCHAGGPVELTWLFIYRLEDSAFGFKPQTLLQLLSLVRDIGKQRLQFDTTEMGCPFDLSMTYRQPFMPNKVNQIETADTRRRPLIQWLEGMQLQLLRDAEDAVFADTTTVTVPCVKIDLKPKENS